MSEFFLLCVRLAVLILPAALFVGGCSELAKFFHSRASARRSADAYRADLYRVAGSVARRRRLSDRMTQALKRIEKEGASEYVGLHRANHCGCPNCGGSYSDYIDSLNKGGGDVG